MPVLFKITIMQKVDSRSDKSVKFENKKEISINPSKSLSKFIKFYNLTAKDNNFHPVLSLDDICEYYENSSYFEVWAEREKLSQHPKLLRYLRSVNRRRGSSWITALDKFKEARDFMKIFIEMAEEYQEQELQKDSALSLLRENGNPLWIYAVSRLKYGVRYVDPNSKNQHTHPILNPYKTLEQSTDDKREELGRKLLEFASGYISLSVENHQVNISFGTYIDTIRGTDLRRLKLCVVCSKLIWANPLNKKYCGSRCANVQLQRNLRANSDRRDEINRQRRNNYKQKTRTKKLKDSKNGTL